MQKNLFLGTNLHVLKITLFVVLIITRHYGKWPVMQKQHIGAVNDFRGTEAKIGIPWSFSQKVNYNVKDLFGEG